MTRVNTFALTRADQSRDIRRAHPGSRLVLQGQNKWRKPALQISSPVSTHGPPLQKADHL
jgi:hypothetical protein